MPNRLTDGRWSTLAGHPVVTLPTFQNITHKSFRLFMICLFLFRKTAERATQSTKPELGPTPRRLLSGVLEVWDGNWFEIGHHRGEDFRH